MHSADFPFCRPAALRVAAGLFCLAAAGAAPAAPLFGAPEGGFNEQAAKPPPAFDINRLIEIDPRPNNPLQLGVDPATISSDDDGVVRYVLVARARSGGPVTAQYEGVRCQSAEVKVYARHYSEGGWRPVAEPEWKSLYSGGMAQHSLKIARAGVCQDAAPGGTARRIVQVLENDILRNSP